MVVDGISSAKFFWKLAADNPCNQFETYKNLMMDGGCCSTIQMTHEVM